MRIFEEEEGWKKKSGHFSEGDEAFYGRLFSEAGNLSSSSRKSRNWIALKGLTFRARQIETGWQYSTGPEVIVKVASNTKSKSNARQMVAYISRVRGKDDRAEKPELYDQFGLKANVSQLNGWDLMSDEKNLSKKAREVAEKKTLEEMTERQRLHNIQAWHLVLSIKDDEEEELNERFTRAIKQFVRKAFANEQHKVLWCLHDEHIGRLHAHLIIKAQSEVKRRLHFDKPGDYLHGLRTLLAIELHIQGIHHSATRREDRFDLREQIFRGNEPLRTKRTVGDYHRKPIILPTVETPKEKRAGEFHWFEKANEGETVAQPHEWFVQNYLDPMEAWKRYEQFEKDNGYAKAIWYLTKCPELFETIPVVEGPRSGIFSRFKKPVAPTPIPIPHSVLNDRRKATWSIIRAIALTQSRHEKINRVGRIWQELQNDLRVPISSIPQKKSLTIILGKPKPKKKPKKKPKIEPKIEPMLAPVSGDPLYQYDEEYQKVIMQRQPTPFAPRKRQEEIRIEKPRPIKPKGRGL